MNVSVYLSLLLNMCFLTHVCVWIFALVCISMHAWLYTWVCTCTYWFLSAKTTFPACVRDFYYSGFCAHSHARACVMWIVRLHVCLWEQWRVMMFCVLLLAASLPTVKVISLFSPLPAAATRDRLTNTNHLDGRSREREGKKGRGERKRECERVIIANRNSAEK